MPRLREGSVYIRTDFSVQFQCDFNWGLLAHRWGSGFGRLAAQYGGSNRAVLDVWRPAEAVEWGIPSPDTLFYTNCADFESWVIELLPAVSGYPYSEDAPGGNRIIGDRIMPPAEDPYLFIRARREKINAADKTDEGGGLLRGRSRVRFLDAPGSYHRPMVRSDSKAKPSIG